jgi:hypothetical protein
MERSGQANQRRKIKTRIPEEVQPQIQQTKI